MQKDKLHTQKDKLHMQKDKLHMQKVKLHMQKDKLHMQKDNLQMQKDKLQVQKDKFHMQKDKLHLQICVNSASCNARAPHRVGRVLSFFSVVGIGTPPPPSAAGECATPPFGPRGGAHTLAGEGLG
jgi:hypothetical protein